MRGGGCSFPSSASTVSVLKSPALHLLHVSLLESSAFLLPPPRHGRHGEYRCAFCAGFLPAACWRCLHRAVFRGAWEWSLWGRKPFVIGDLGCAAIFWDFLSVASPYVTYSAGLGLSRVQAGLSAGLDRAELVHASYETTCAVASS